MSTRKRQKAEPAWFKIDENGKTILLPLQIPPEFTEPSSLSANKYKSSGSKPKRKLSLKPMCISDIDIEGSPRKATGIRPDRTISKNLFKVPATKIGSSQKRQNKESPFFGVDENGKTVLLPLQIPPEFMDATACPSANKNKSSANKRKRQFDLKPLLITNSDLEEPSERPAKMRKTQKSVRKELFKVPAAKVQPKRQSVRLSASRQSLSNRKMVRQTLHTLASNTPLMDAEKAERALITKSSVRIISKGYPFNSPAKPVINFVKLNKEKVKFSAKNINQKTDSTDQHSDSFIEREFLELEKACTTPKINVISPNGKTIKKINGIKDINKLELETELKGLLDEDKREFDLLKEQFQTFCQSHDSKREKIKQIMEKLRTVQQIENKENLPRRKSNRLLNPSVKANLFKSPGKLKPADLRKATLMKNLENVTVNSQLLTPRSKKATILYDTIRNDINILGTPKVTRNNSGSPKSIKQTLSAKLIKQCLMLQGTPMHK